MLEDFPVVLFVQHLHNFVLRESWCVVVEDDWSLMQQIRPFPSDGGTKMIADEPGVVVPFHSRG